MDAAIPVQGLFETHLTVSDLDRSVDFYQNTLGLKLANRIDERSVAFFWLGGVGNTMLGIWAVGTAPLGMKLHTAFKVDLDSLLKSVSVLKKAGIVPRDFYGKPTDEPSVIAWAPSASVYFLDPDGNNLEYLTMLDPKGKPSTGIMPYSEWENHGQK